jgi:PKD repeat protein
MAKKRLLTAVATAAALALIAGCSVHNQQAPSLTGPSGLGTTVTVAVNPDVLPEDGASAALVSITVTGPSGQPVPNTSLRVDAALGTLSARNVITNSSGQATAVFTAPSAGQGLPSVDVQIVVTPAETNFANSVSRAATIHLVPVGVVGGGTQSSLKPNFTPPSPTEGENALFTATVTDSSGANAIARVASFNWNFGDGSTATGQSATHAFASAGPFTVTLTIIDSSGGVASVPQTVTVGQGQLPTAVFVTSPSSPNVGDTIQFNASGSTAAAGHVITTFAWTFGDGATGGGPITSHSYSQAQNYTVTLQVTDDVGRTSALVSQVIDVATGKPTVDLQVVPAAPVVPKGSATVAVTFDASASKPAAGHTIDHFHWVFPDGSMEDDPASQTTTTRPFAPGSYTVQLTVIDDDGKSTTATKSFTVTQGT